LRPFCTFFGEVYADSDEGIDIQYQGVGGPAVLGLLSFTVEDVERCLRGLDASKASGPDEIPPHILKSCSDGFKRPLTLLFNRSLSEAVFPESWKRSYVVPIFKSGKRNLIENYRGIAILSAMPKLLELLVFDLLFFHLKSSIAVVQHGFFKGRLTVLNLMEFASLCIRRMEEGMQTDAVYTVFSKAFDRINHLIPLAKLRSYGIVSKLNSWFSSYLGSRT
jgi:hypothetical protein